MRRAPSALATANAALMCLLLIAASQGLSRPGQARSVIAATPAALATVGGQDPVGGQGAVSGIDAVSNSGLDPLGGLDARISAASTEAAKEGAVISVVVHDRATERTRASGETTAIPTASVAKLFIADDLLYRASTGQTPLSREDRAALDTMLQSSDDDAAEQFWQQGGGDEITMRVAARYGLTATGPGSDGRWWNTITTAADLVRYYDMLLDGTGGLPPASAQIIVDDLAASTPVGVDGYPQRFGIPDALNGEPVAVKQGWMCCIGPDWMHLSTGLIGPQHRYIMVIESEQPTDDGDARDTITAAVRTMFPGGRI